jgi:integrase
MKVEDYYTEGRKAWFRLYEKGGKRHEVPAHHNAADYVDAYIAAADIASDKKGPLFRSIGGRQLTLTDRPIDARNALHMIKRRANVAGLPETIGNHTFRATGITAYLENGGTIDVGQSYCLLRYPYPDFSSSRFADNASARVSIFHRSDLGRWPDSLVETTSLKFRQ